MKEDRDRKNAELEEAQREKELEDEYIKERD